MWNIPLILALMLSFFAALGMVLGDNVRNHMAHGISNLQGKVYDGHGPTNATRARRRPRTLKNFSDARVRQDQYNRKDEPMKSRKKGGVKP